MNDRDRKILIAALLVSVLAHVLIALPIWDMPIGQSQAALFNRPTPAEQSVPAYRMPAEDMYAESLDPQQAEPLAVEGAGETPKAIERASRDMLERLDPMTMLPEETKAGRAVGRDRRSAAGRSARVGRRSLAAAGAVARCLGSAD
jgi:hypothetical protein